VIEAAEFGLNQAFSEALSFEQVFAHDGFYRIRTPYPTKYICASFPKSISSHIKNELSLYH
jgi:hypothetical protein